MNGYYGCDAHKHYSVFAMMDEQGRTGRPVRVEHTRAMFREFLKGMPAGSPIAIESVGNWYWMIEEMERAGHSPRLTNPRKAKMMMGQINKTDKLDAGGLAMLLRNGTLPSVWIPPGALRDQRELPRMRMSLVSVRTMLKNRIHATLAKYAIDIGEVSDLFGVKGREMMGKRLEELPPFTRQSVETQLELLDEVKAHIERAEAQIGEVVETTPAMKLLMTIPGVGPILAVVIASEVGDIDRFPNPEHLASYAGTVPRIRSSGGKTSYGPVRPDVNRYLKWALIEAANMIVLGQRHRPDDPLTRLYQRLREKKGHAKAVVAVARHMATAIFWILKKNEAYKAPNSSSQE